jgi:hypothetical protein
MTTALRRIRDPFCAILLLMIVLSPAHAADLIVFAGAAPEPAPVRARVRSLATAEIWIFSSAAERDAALTKTGTGIPISTGGPTGLQRRDRSHALELIEGVRSVWSDGELRIVEADPGGSGLDLLDSCVEPLEYLPRASAPPALSIAARQTSPEDEAALVASVDGVRYTQILRELTGDLDFPLGGSTKNIRTRWALDPSAADGINLARDYLTDRFESAGYEVLHQDFDFTYLDERITATNVVAVKTGSVNPDEILVVGAHYDARAETAGLDSPGAEDNASGTASVLHLAELLSNWETERTIHFVAFGCEEYALRGSIHYVEQAVAANLDIVGALTMDMISAWSTDYGILIEGATAWEELMTALLNNVIQWTDLSYELSYDSFGSDHVPFQQAGIPALLGIDLDWAEYSDYHQSTDTFDKLDPSLGTSITRAMAGTIADIVGISRTVAIDDPVPGVRTAGPRLALNPNLPNPFNPRTSLRFTLPEAGPTLLEIVDLRGRRVRTIVSGWLEAGPHTRLWDGRDEDGMAVSSGLYFSRLEHPGGVRSRRMTLLR